jgi:flagellar hook-associated protein 1 FlgK
VADLLSILTNSASGLAAHQAAVAVAGANIQNANTPGYSVQRPVLETQPAELEGQAWIGRGVTLQTVAAQRDIFIERQLPAAASAQAGASAESNALASVTALDPDGAGSLSQALAGFYSSLQSLSQNAGDSSLRTQALASANALAVAFNGASSALESSRAGLDAQISGTLSDVNKAAATVASLNRQIKIAQAGGATPNDLIDARQTAADQLSQLTGASQVPDGNGDLQILLPGGGALVSGDKAGSLSAIADPANGGHLAVQITKPDGSGLATVASSAFGGTIGGVLAARDGAIKTAEDGLDQLAYDLTGAMNAVHAAGTGLDGVSGRNLFVPQASVAGAASRLAVDPSVAGNPDALAAAASAAALPGDASNLNALIATQSTPLSGGKTPASTLAGIVTEFGSSAATSSSLATQNQTILTNLQTQRDSASGVSLDEEMINLTKSQRAYQAVAQVVTTTNALLGTLMTIAGT